MDFATAAYAIRKAKEYTNSQRLGYSESNSITFDGDATGKEVFPVDLGAIRIVKVSNKTPAISEIESITLISADAGGIYTKETFEITGDSEVQIIAAQNTPLVYVVYSDLEDGPTKGTYAADVDAYDAYVSKIELTETIHQIDPKFIPGAVLPVVELSATSVDNASEEGKPLTDEEIALMDSAWNVVAPCVINFSLRDVPTSAIFARLTVGGTRGYQAVIGGYIVNLQDAGDGWVASMTLGGSW